MRTIEKEELQETLEQHKMWLSSDGKEGKRANLRFADFHGVNLRFADFRGADFHGADFYGADLRFADLSSADLSFADLRFADLRYANFSGADFSGADLDYSAFPLWCGGLDINIDDRQATQLLYHLVRNVTYSKNTSEALKNLFKQQAIVDQANKFHRVDSCGKLNNGLGGEEQECINT